MQTTPQITATTINLQITMTAGYCMETDEPLEADSWETTAEAFIAENGFEGEDADEILAMEVGGLVTFGGGAAPYFEVERVL